MKHWIDNADSYICPDCGFETGCPNNYEGAKCPKCGFQDEKDKKPIWTKRKTITCTVKLNGLGLSARYPIEDYETDNVIVITEKVNRFIDECAEVGNKLPEGAVINWKISD